MPSGSHSASSTGGSGSGRVGSVGSDGDALRDFARAEISGFDWRERCGGECV